VVIALRPAKVEDLCDLGLSPPVAMVNLGGGHAYTVCQDGEPVAAGGLFYHPSSQSYEAWLVVSNAVQARPIAILRPLVRQLRTLQARFPVGTLVHVYEGPDAVAFARLALVFGFRIEGKAHSPIGPVRRAVSVGEANG
jgi:hypothetical protein